ncbi:MAG TPA: hypothetical protein VFF73_21840 [Planctomycetota bacterium]|nr:hypothetical protein [Planctomycetota bacterium]
MAQSSGLNTQSVPHGTELRLDSAIAGCQNAFPPGVPALPIRNTSFNQADLQTKLVALDAPFKQGRAAHASVRSFTSQKPQYIKDARQFLADLKAALAGAVGSDNELLASWGFKVSKPKKPLTSEQKVLRAAKAKLTRQKRGTLGSKQKAAIKTTTMPNVSINSSTGESSFVPVPGSSDGTDTPATPATSGNAAVQPPVSGSGGSANVSH